MGTIVPSLWFLSLITLSFGQTTNDIVGTPKNEPICISVTANDNAGTVITSFTNSTNGKTYTNYPPFYYANSSNYLVFEVENHQIANFANTNDPDYIGTFPTVWTNATSSSASGGIYSFPSPDAGVNTGNTMYGRALVFNVMFQNTGTYQMAMRGKGPNTDGDSAHVLFQPALNSTINFVSKGGNAFALDTSWTWYAGQKSLTVTKTAPTVSRFFLAMREDGSMADQIAIYRDSYPWFGAAASRFLSCGSDQILYFPNTGYTGIDTFTYEGTQGNSTSTGTVSVYVGVALPSVSPTPSRSSSPSRSPTPTSSPSATPSRTPSVTPSPSINSSPSITPTSTPSASVTPSASPTSSVTPTVTPTASATASVTPTPSITPTPSPLPPMCDGVPSASASFHRLTPHNETSNFGQTFRPFATGELLSVSFYRASTDTGILNGTVYLLLGVVTDPDSGVTLRSFPFSMSGPGIQTFLFDPPQRLDATRYLFLLDSIEGDSPASMALADTILMSQYTVLDQEIDSMNTAVFSYCLIPDYVPSPSTSPSISSTPSPTSSVIAQPAGSDKKKSNSAAAAGAAVGSIAFVAVAAAIAFVFIRRQRKKQDEEDSPKTDLELHSTPPKPKQEVPYQPIGALIPVASGHYSTIPVESEWNIEYDELKLTKEIGRGAFGVVYQGTWKGVDIAVKQALLEASSATKFQVQDFFGEAEVMKKLKPHPNVTRLLGLCTNPLCIVLEFVDNGSLWTWLESNKPLDKATQISIARGIAEGMLYLHNEGIIHRDLAARNILLDSNMCPKVSDFGMSRQVLENKTNKTASEIGPIRWMAPEAMRQRVYNTKTDSWSYGAVLYEILTRQMPFYQYDLVHVATSVSLKELSLVPEIQKEAEEKGYPPVIVNLMEGCLAFESENRPEFDRIIQIFDSNNNNNNV